MVFGSAPVPGEAQTKGMQSRKYREAIAVTIQLTFDDHRRAQAAEAAAHLLSLGRWDCAICGKRVTRQSGHAPPRVRRLGGWDHARCHKAAVGSPRGDA